MAIGINDLDDDDFGMGIEDSNLNLTVVEDSSFLLDSSTTINNLDDNDLLSDFLKTRGIDDISRIKFEDEKGNIEEKNWNSLSKEEKLNILSTPLEVDNNQDTGLTNDEIHLINQIRLSNMSPSLYINSLTNQDLSAEPQYKIDDLSDDELFILDLESRVGELSDELAVQALTTAKENEDLFKKQVEGIRREYKEREDYLAQQEQAYIELERQEAYNRFQDSVINSINLFDSIGNLDLDFDDSDREELALFMLSRDESGNNYLWQALQDPDVLVKAAWFILNGDEALNNISDYFINLIKLVSENQYKKGFEEGKSGSSPSRPQVVISNQNNNPRRIIKSIDDLDED